MQQYFHLIENILENGTSHDDRTGVGTLSVFAPDPIRFDLSTGGFPLMTTKRIPFRWVVEELRWFISGSTNEKDLRATGVDIWKEWATEEQCAKFGRSEGDLGPVYGYLWRHFGGEYDRRNEPQPTPQEKLMHGTPRIYRGRDQLAHVVSQLLNDRNSRRIIITGWDAAECDKVALPPCHTLTQFKVTNVEGLCPLLHTHLYMRSCDAFLGLPFNIATYALLTHILAFAADIYAGTLTISFGDLHIYKNHIEQVHEQLGRQPYELPALGINGQLRGLGMRTVEGFTFEDLMLSGYTSWPSIKAPVAI